MPPTKQVKVFISYAHEDQELRKQLEAHLSALKHSGKIAVWQDQEILPGEIWNDQIKASLKKADLVLLLVSSGFLASDYIREEEVREALERHKAGTVQIIPIILRPVDWQDTPLGQLQALPRGAKPVTEWNNQDTAFKNVAQDIRIAVEGLRKEKIREITDNGEENTLTAAKTIDYAIVDRYDIASRKKDLKTRKLPETITSPFLTPVKAVASKRRYQVLSLLLAIILVTTTLITLSFSRIFPSTAGGTGIGVINEPNNEQIGLSDGTYAFDVGDDRPDASLKKQAAEKFAHGDKDGARLLWNQAVGKAGIDTNDAEALIYLEDQHVLASGSPYITLVVGAMLTGNAGTINTGRNNLQGAYVAQKEYNDGFKLSGGRMVRLLIANAGSKEDYVTEVAGRIVQAAKQDPTIVGVMGWSRSAYAHKAIDVLGPEHIPMVSSTASADDLSGISPYFFHVAPLNKGQAIAGAKYAEEQLHASRVALFVDPKNSYSSDLGGDFKQQFVDVDGKQIIDTENYTVGDKASLLALLQKALNSNPDLIYFAGYADDLAVLLVNLPTSLPNLQVLGGDALYAPTSYPSSAKPGFSRLHFTAFAYPDEWGILGMNEPLFFSEYPDDFNPAHADHSANPYGFTRANYGTILSYDATFALLQGCQNVMDAQITLTPEALRNGLIQITGAQAIQGVSGQISFGSNGDPIDKAVVILYVNPEGYIHMLQPNGVLGCFVVGKCV